MMSDINKEDFAGKAVIVTGSSGGIGRGIAMEFAKLGASVTIHGQSEQKLKTTKEALKEEGIPSSRIHSVRGPIQENGTLIQLVQETLSRFGRIDVLINNAGCLSLPGEDVASLKTFDFVMAVNVRSIVELTDLCTEHLEKTRGNVINISSVASLRIISPSNRKFCGMSKAALDYYTKAAVNLLSHKGIRVNGISPGLIQSDIRVRAGFTSEELKAFENKAAEMILVGRIGQPMDIGKMCTFLADNSKASFITGSQFVVDGGALVK